MANSSQWFEEIKLLGRYNAPTKYLSSSSGFVPSSGSPRFVPVSASRKVTKALLGSFGATGEAGMTTSTAEVVAMADEEVVFAGINTVPCSFPGVCGNKDIDLVASCLSILAMSFSPPDVRTGEPLEAILASRRL